MRRHRAVLLLVICTTVAGLVVLVFIGLREMQRDYYRVAPEESAACAWIAEKRGTLQKEGKDRHIVEVNLGGTNVTDLELGRLRDLTRLRELDLSGTQITDAGLSALAPLKELEYVDVSNTDVTLEGFKAFVSQHPQLKKRWEGTDE